MRLVQRHGEPHEATGRLTEGARVHGVGEPVGDHPGQGLGRRIRPRQRRVLVEIAVGQPGHHPAQLGSCTADVDDDAVSVQPLTAEGCVHHVGGTVEALGRPEHLTTQAVGDHQVVADRHAEHAAASGSGG